MTFRRINFWGGPGAGKTSMASLLYGKMKAKGYKVHFSEESVNSWIYQGRVPPEGYDDLLLFAQQIHAEEVCLNPRKAGAKRPRAAAADYIVTDCPPLMCCVYNQRRQVPYHDHLVKIALYYEEEYPSLNIFVERSASYDKRGRFHTRQEAKAIDRVMLQWLDQHRLEYRRFHVTEAEKAIKYVLNKIRQLAKPNK
jgi:adenylate kinase family enzyme